MLKNKNFKIALYIRVSTEEQAENPEGSIKSQEQRLRETVHYKNLNSHFGEIVGVYIDRGISAKDMNRPRLQEMLAAIGRQEVNLVMVTELSRLSRNNRDFFFMWDLMHEQDCRFMSLREDFDTTTAAGEMLLFQLMNFAQFERKQTSERVKANVSARSRRGLYNGGCVPFGYALIPNKPGYLQIDPKAAKIVKTAFCTFLTEGSLAATARAMNDNGYTLPKRLNGGGSRLRMGHFTVDNLHRMLKHKAYIGVKTYQHKGETQETKAVWKPIIDEVTFYKVGEKLKKNCSRLKPKSFYKYPYLLTGINFCMSCGSFMSGKSATGKSGKVAYYEHSWATKRDSTLAKKSQQCDPHRVLAKRLEPVVWRELTKFLTEPSFIEKLLKEVSRYYKKDPAHKEVKALKTRLHSINSQIEATAERLTELPKSISAAPIFKQLERLEKTKDQIEASLEKMGSNPFDLKKRLVKLETFEGFAGYYRKFLAQAEPEMKRNLIQKFIHKVEVGKENIKIHWNLDQSHYEQEWTLLGRSGSGSQFSKNLFAIGGSQTLTNGRG